MNKYQPGKSPRNTKHCSYRNCRSDGRYNPQDLFYFIPFPKPCLPYRHGRYHETPKQHVKCCVICQKSELWLKLCRPKFGMQSIDNIQGYHFICSLHFVGESWPTDDYPYPNQADNKRKGAPIRTNLEQKYQRSHRQQGAPLGHTPAMEDISNSNNDDMIPITIPASSIPVQSIRHHFYVDASTETDLNITAPVEKTIETSSTQTDSKHDNKMTQTNYTIFPHLRRLNWYKKKYEEGKVMLQRAHPIRKMEQKIKENSKLCFFYTGLTIQHILILMNFLKPALDDMLYWQSTSTSKVTRPRRFTPIQELLIVLIRLRRGFPVQDLAYRFQLSTGQISKLVTTYVQLLYHHFSKLRPYMFPSRQKIHETLPCIFKRLKNIRVIVDAAEFFCESPSNFEQQGNLYSSYKVHTTFKVLLGCTPNGVISYVSQLYEGSISDRELFDQCGIKDLLEEGDLVLADRGFTVNDIVEGRGASLNIPPFLKGRVKLTAQEEIETKQIAKERIYIEHVVGRLKRYRLLKQVIPLKMRGTLSRIVFVCACLVNFQPPILLD